MASLLNKARAFFDKNQMAVLFVVIALLVIVFLVMEDGYAWVKRLLKPKKEGFEASSDAENTLYMFYVDWCPHCTKAKPELERLRREMEVDTIENQRVVVRLVNAEKEEKLASKFKVEGYPTIIFVKKGKDYTYEGERTANAIKAFMTQKIKENK